VLAAAVKVRSGTAPLPYEDSREFWWRSTLGSFGVAVLAGVLLGIMYFLIVVQELTAAAGVVQLALLLMLIPAAAGLLFWALALEDFFQALAVFGIYVLLPGLVLTLVGVLLTWLNWMPGLPSWLYTAT
jgi:hypothetical protein